MRIFRNSTAEYLLIISTAYGQLPYHALTFLSLPYENVKDAFQKLCRAGYLESVKAPGHKSFFLTDSGYEAYLQIMMKDDDPPDWEDWEDFRTSRNSLATSRRLSVSAASTKRGCSSFFSGWRRTGPRWKSSVRWSKRPPATRITSNIPALLA